jgi:hypothetical protein
MVKVMAMPTSVPDAVGGKTGPPATFTLDLSAEPGGPGKSHGYASPPAALLLSRPQGPGYETIVVDPPTSPQRPIAPFTAGYAARLLDVSKRQLDKLVDCGLIRVAAATPAGHRRLDANDVAMLALRAPIGNPDPGDLAVHLAPLTTDTEPAHQRTHLGWHTDATSRGLSTGDIEDAWAGLWKVDPEQHIGAALVGDVAGFVVAVATITGYRRIAGRVRFTISTPTAEVAARYAGRRFTAIRGDMVQRLSATRHRLR